MKFHGQTNNNEKTKVRRSEREGEIKPNEWMGFIEKKKKTVFEK